MKIFISHSNEDKEIATKLSFLLESMDGSINTFCTSQYASIKPGRDFAKEITEQLDLCEIFIPLITLNYYKSRFCMIELGFAYACLYRSKEQSDYIYPLAVQPVKKAEALAHTPLERLQVCLMNDVQDMRMFIEDLCKSRNISLVAGLNQKIHSFIHDINAISYNNFNLLDNVKILVCKSGDVRGEDHDYLKYSIDADGLGYTVNFRAKPFDNSTSYPDFLSFVFQYIDKIDLYYLVNIYENAKLSVQIDNYTNSISKIDLEIKYSNNNNILHRQTILLNDGVNDIIVPLSEIKSEALMQTSEICFVIKPSAYIEDEGMFQIRNFSIIL